MKHGTLLPDREMLTMGANDIFLSFPYRAVGGVKGVTNIWVDQNLVTNLNSRRCTVQSR
jgi:hypothetical protein